MSHADDERIFGRLHGRLHAVGVRFMRAKTSEGAGQVWVVGEVQEAPEGYVLTLLDDYGQPLKRVVLDHDENTVREEAP